MGGAGWAAALVADLHSVKYGRAARSLREIESVPESELRVSLERRDWLLTQIRGCSSLFGCAFCSLSKRGYLAAEQSAGRLPGEQANGQPASVSARRRGRKTMQLLKAEEERLFPRATI